jgi:hypothetical protein
MNIIFDILVAVAIKIAIFFYVPSCIYAYIMMLSVAQIT